MNKVVPLLLLLMCVFVFTGCSKNNVGDIENQNGLNDNKLQQSSECEKAGGVSFSIKECDGSESEWCKISEEEQCYSDQVKSGKCIVGEYDEELGGIVGVTPRVVCDGLENGQ